VDPEETEPVGEYKPEPVNPQTENAPELTLRTNKWVELTLATTMLMWVWVLAMDVADIWQSTGGAAVTGFVIGVAAFVVTLSSVTVMTGSTRTEDGTWYGRATFKFMGLQRDHKKD
jgi:hypothetical protein